MGCQKCSRIGIFSSRFSRATAAVSMSSYSLPTAGCWHPPTIAPSGCGIRPPDSTSRPSRAMATVSGVLRSLPTAGCWHLLPSIAPSGCGIRLLESTTRPSNQLPSSLSYVFPVTITIYIQTMGFYVSLLVPFLHLRRL